MAEVINNPFSKLVDFLESQKQANRAQEDAEIDRRITLIHDLITSPGANPARTAEGLSNLMDLYAAKGGRTSKPSKGQGPWGKSDIPMPSLLAGIIHGQIPFEGPTTEPVPQPQTPAQQGLMPEASAQLPGLKGFDGKEILNTPVMVPPEPLQAPPEASRMLSAARDMQRYNEGPKTRPVANQPMMKTGEEMGREKAGIQAATDQTMMQAEYDQAVKMLKAGGADDATAAKTAGLMVMEKHGLKQPAMAKPVAGSNKPYVYTGPDGKPVIVNGTTYLNPDGTSVTRNSVTNMPLPPDAQEYFKPGGSGSPYTTHWEQDAQGVWHVSYAAKDPGAGFDPKTLTTGIVGHLPPAPTFVYDTPDPNHPGQTIPVVRPKVVTGNPAGTAPGTNPPKAQKLGTEEQSFVDTAQGMQKTMDRINKSIEDAGIQHSNSISDWSSTQVQNWWRKQGFEPNQLQADLQQRVGYLRATLLRSLLGGRPNKYVTEIFQSHLPAEFQTPAQIYNTMKLIKQEIQDRYDGIQKGHGGQPLPTLGGSDQQGAGNDDFAKFLDALKKKQ